MGTKSSAFYYPQIKLVDYLCIFATEIRYGTFMSLHDYLIFLQLCNFSIIYGEIQKDS